MILAHYLHHLVGLVPASTRCSSPFKENFPVCNDVAFGISTSGGSRNIVLALEEARKRNLLTVALLGYDGGEILRRGLADFPLIVRSDYIPRIQEVQASIYHVIRETLEDHRHA